MLVLDVIRPRWFSVVRLTGNVAADDAAVSAEEKVAIAEHLQACTGCALDATADIIAAGNVYERLNRRVAELEKLIQEDGRDDWKMGGTGE